MLKVLSYLALTLITLSSVRCATPVLECGNGIPLPTLTQVNDCVELPCPFALGTTVEMNATFTSPVFTEALTPEVIAYALGAEVNYPLSEPDGCNSLIDAVCPIDEGQIVTYNLQMPIIGYPPIPLRLKFTLFDETDAGIICFIIDAEVVV